jgi:hypothetical protein
MSLKFFNDELVVTHKARNTTHVLLKTYYHTYATGRINQVTTVKPSIRQ